MAFQLLFIFSFVLESAVFHEDEVSSLNKLEGDFAQRHSFMKATFIAVNTDLKRRIICSYGDPGSINLAVMTNKDANMIYGNEQQY